MAKESSVQKWFNFLLILITALTSYSCVSARSSSKNITQVGQRLHKKGLTIDAHYDRRLDGLIPGYKVITIALTNQSFNIIKLNPLRDKWVIEDVRGRKVKAINSIRITDPDKFARLPPKIRQLVSYPNGVSMGYTETFDVFFPQSTELDGFRSIHFFNATLKEKWEVVQIPDNDPRHQKTDAEVDVPQSFPAQYKQYSNPGGHQPTIPMRGSAKRIKKADLR